MSVGEVLLDRSNANESGGQSRPLMQRNEQSRNDLSFVDHKQKKKRFGLRCSSAANANTSDSCVLLYGKITVIARYHSYISMNFFMLVLKCV